MARFTAATYGLTALIAQLLVGLVQSWDTAQVLVQGLLALLIASCLGWIVGSLALVMASGTPQGASFSSKE